MRILNSFPCCDCAITAATAKQGVVLFIKTMELIFALARLRVILAWAAKEGLKWLWAVHKTYKKRNCITIIITLEPGIEKTSRWQQKSLNKPFFPF